MAIIREFIVMSFLSTALLGSVYSQSVLQKNSINVLSPDHLRALYNAAIGNFGSTNQTRTVTGSLVYPRKGSNFKGCKSFDGSNTFTSSSSRQAILFFDRVDCYFSLKVWNGQKAGAAGVLVADHVDEPLTSVTRNSRRGTTASKEKIRIPSAFITKSLDDTQRKAMENGEEILIKIG